ncbi:lysophospholipid acyltransferase family protein [Caenimonas koreensis]|uniref:Lipid A biosynthesis acyltransferase n=1 Tax=Caenimonas koreensis DSM 17982 TaxID=1121255 RepID=A0A844B651_9BURK|nr:lipid A biosynthesis acyltransferase [Caenimonas koreensis]MRD47129.1 lipid A biosynthesis acyltransferase [Caenimonas koreensis DSM 17982]
MSHVGVWFMRALAHLPLTWIRALGWLLGWVLYIVIVPRRRIARRNIDLCFPQWPQQQRAALIPRIFVAFAQAWLDRSWLWHGKPPVTLRRLKLTGAVEELTGSDPALIFVPHFVGMDAGWTACTQQLTRAFSTLYTPQSNAVVDAWILKGRQRYGHVELFRRADGVKAIVASLRRGERFCLLPDMNYGAQESVFVPFYGVSAATVPSLSRFAKLGRARVVPLITRITKDGYETRAYPAWRDFPTDDPVADTALMNERLQGFIDEIPEQYYWVHKRFKSRPPGEPPVY